MACRSQAFIATLLLVPSMSARPVIETQKSVSDCSPANRERELGWGRRETGQFNLTDELCAAIVIEVCTRGTLGLDSW